MILAPDGNTVGLATDAGDVLADTIKGIVTALTPEAVAFFVAWMVLGRVFAMVDGKEKAQTKERAAYNRQVDRYERSRGRL